MQEIYKYLYALSAACFIGGVGSGFVTLTPFALEYEEKALKIGFEFEQTINAEYEDGFNCKAYPNMQAQCKYAEHLIRTKTELIELLMLLGRMLAVAGLAFFVIGMYFHWIFSIRSSTA